MSRGGFIHNQVMVTRLRQATTEAGAWSVTEAYLGAGVGSGDLVAGNGRVMVLVEVERSPVRAVRDLVKARAIGATHLVVATPTERVSAAIRRRLAPLAASGDPVIIVKPLALAAQHLTDLLNGCFPAELQVHTAANKSSVCTDQEGTR